MKPSAAPAWLLIAALLGCATAPAPREEAQRVPAVPEEDVKAASDRLLDCYVGAAQRLDDRSSDATTVGIAVAAECALEADNFASVVTRGQSDERKRAFRHAWRHEGKQQATAVVMHLREMGSPSSK